MMPSKRLYRKALLGTAALLPLTICAQAAQAQGLPGTNTPPVRDVVDEYGVDLSTGALRVPSPVVSIGGAEGLTFNPGDLNGGSWRHNYTINIVTGTVNGQQVYRVQIGESRRDFQLVGGVFEPLDGLPGTLSTDANLYTDANGVKYHFYTGTSFWMGEFLHRLGHRIEFPGGREETLTYFMKYYYYSGSGYGGTYYLVPQLRSVTSNNSYQLKFEYDQTSTYLGASLSPTKAIALNSSVEYCDPAAETCTLTGDWPSLDFGTNITDNLGRTTSIVSVPSSVTVTRPGETQAGLVANLDSNYRVTSLTVENSYTRTYSWTTNGNDLTSVSNDSLGRQVTTVVDTSENVVTSRTDALGNTTSFAHDSEGRVTEVTAPEGQKVQYSYDSRGNLTTTIAIAEPGSGLANIVTTATYPTACSNPVICNKPTSVTDANGNTTNFTYDAVHGGVTQVQAPSDGSGQRPTTNITYGSVTAKTKDSSGTLVNQTTSITKPIKATQCATAQNCANSVNERVVEYTYDNAVSANAHATSVETRAGNSSVSATTDLTYTDLGLVETSDGPASGTADTTTFLYDSAGRTIGVIGPDPDGSGSLPRLAERMTYDDFDNVITAEAGTVTGTSQSAWNAFNPTSKFVSEFDSFGRLEATAQVATSGTTQYSITQYGYDASLRLECIAQRMNAPLTTTTLPSDACTPMSAGSFGSDRIAKRTYDTVDRVTKVETGVGSSLAQDTVETNYNANGNVAWVEDAANNRTSYTYDGHSRLQKTAFPSATTAGTSNTSDTIELAYDDNGNVTSVTGRDGSSITLTYDALNRLTKKDLSTRADLPSTHRRDVFYSYDLRGRLTSARFDSTSGPGVVYAYDALDRLTSETQNTDGTTRTVSSQYDASSNRTRITHSDGSYFTYDHDVLNRLTNLRQSTTILGTTYYTNDGLTDRMVWTQNTLSNNRRDYSYDAANRLDQISLDLNNTSRDVTWDFSSNPAGQIVSEAQSNDDYSWDGLVSVNRSYTSNGLNQYSAVAGTSFCYDDNGNLTADGANVYLYDFGNRLVQKRTQTNSNCASLSYSGALQAELSYDPTGRLYQVSGGTGGTQRFLYDGNALIGEFNGSGTMLRRYVHGTNPGFDDPLVWYEGSSVSNSDRRILHADPRGSIVAVTNHQGTSIATNSYDEFGIPDTAAGNDISTKGRFRYTGQTWIPELGMYHYKARVYSPTLGRFMQTDPIGYDDGMNMYAYVGNDPINGVDPSGLCLVRTSVDYGGAGTKDNPLGPITIFGVSRSYDGCDESDFFGSAANRSSPGVGSVSYGGAAALAGQGGLSALPQSDTPCWWAPLSGADAQLADDIQRSNLFHVSARLAIGRTARSGNEHSFFIIRMEGGGYGTTNIYEGRAGDTGPAAQYRYNVALQKYGDRLVGQFHTHPSSAAYPGGALYPSSGDGITAARRGILSFIGGANGQELGNVTVGKQRVCR